MYGNNDNLNYKLKIDKLIQKVENWNFVRLNICDKVIAIKTYFIGLFQYQMRAFKMSDTFMKKINLILFTFLWSSSREKIAWKILTQEKHNGGMAMTDLNLRWEANILINIRKMESQIFQPWSALCIYWFGFY